MGGPQEFQLPLFSRAVSPGASHTLSMQGSSAGSSNSFDVDFAVITLGDGDDTWVSCLLRQT
jgi:hypothetical protein